MPNNLISPSLTPLYFQGQWRLIRVIQEFQESKAITLHFFEGLANFTPEQVPLNKIALNNDKMSGNSYRGDDFFKERTIHCDSATTVLNYKEMVQNKDKKLKSSQSYLYIFRPDEVIIEFPFSHFYGKSSQNLIEFERLNFDNPLAKFSFSNAIDENLYYSPQHVCNQDIYRYILSFFISSEYQFFLHSFINSCKSVPKQFASSSDLPLEIIQSFLSTKSTDFEVPFPYPLFIQDIKVTGPKKNYRAITFFIKF
ncbi:DUF6314 family protein [Thorsellia kenyensis]|uniref:DUF6314 family protein n=1 Tax=Thorsellia kenyensis TaxID=1549888 RepID=A0ABV6CD77_9GAMM